MNPQVIPITTTSELKWHVGLLGRLAASAERAAADPSHPVELRCECANLAYRWRKEQEDMLAVAHPADPLAIVEAVRAEEAAANLLVMPAYEHANVLDEGPNVSHKPAPVDPCAWVGACVALTIEAATAIFCLAVYAAAKLAWRLL